MESVRLDNPLSAGGIVFQFGQRAPRGIKRASGGPQSGETRSTPGLIAGPLQSPALPCSLRAEGVQISSLSGIQPETGSNQRVPRSLNVRIAAVPLGFNAAIKSHQGRRP